MEKEKSIESLNEELPEFFLSDLEERLETDPMNVGALVTLQSTVQSDFCWDYINCANYCGCENYFKCNGYF